ncbi:acetate--CoA ligase [Echinicola salinicaeni]|uniref:acetate--CoA ligase n=1 Tax=Echinicola salinicaeni TaxID=2762757 RepID=UPI0016453594|nr:acetate--CoA ligase [Echinicola salinicaeni]
MVNPNLTDYSKTYKAFDWEKESQYFNGPSAGLGLNIAHEAVDRHANGGLGDTTAIRFVRKDQKRENISYVKLQELTSRFANVLDRLGIAKGETVYSLLGRVPELYITALGSLKRLAVFCPLFSVFGPEPIFQRLSKGEASLLVTNKLFYEKKVEKLIDRLPHLRYIFLIDVEEDLSKKVLSFDRWMKKASSSFSIPFTSPEDPALLHFTSGTTGMPKGALHVHKAVYTHYLTGKLVLDFHKNDVFWCTADPGWVTGTSYGIISPLVNGVTSIVDEQEFDAMRWYQILEKEKVNIWYTAPTAIRRLMRTEMDPKKEFDLSKLRLVLSVGEPLHAAEVIWAQQAFGVPVLDNWWQTETGGIMIANYRSMEVAPGSMGKPLPGIEAAVAEIDGDGIELITDTEAQGHLVLKKGFPSMFRAYLHEQERYNKCFIGDWYITGDLARRDRKGYFWFVGRADDIIKTSGHMVGPFEVESSLMKHPSVAEAAVIGKPEASVGEMVKAFVVLKEGVKENSETKLDIIGFARKELGPAVAPKEIAFVQRLPKTRSGKILRRLLKARELGLPEGDLSTLEPS